MQDAGHSIFVTLLLCYFVTMLPCHPVSVALCDISVNLCEILIIK